MAPSEFEFSSNDGQLWTRKLFGLEAQASYFVNEGRGFTMYAGSLTVKFTDRNSLPHSPEFECAIYAAWTRARHLAPAIACKTMRHEDLTYWFEYTVPNEDAVTGWAKETLFLDPNPISLVNMDRQIHERWWKMDESRWNVELHVAPAADEGDWHLMYLAPHLAIDARSMMKLMEYFLDWLVQALNDPLCDPASGLSWGEETIRLPPIAVLATEIFVDNPSALDSCIRESGNAKLCVEEGKKLTSPAMVPFLPPVIVNGQATEASLTNVTELFTLTPTETKKFREVARSRERTVTQLMNSLLALAEVETTLSIAIQSGDADVYPRTVDTYEQATHFLFAFSFVNHRLGFPKHSSVLSTNGTPMFAVDGSNFLIDMDPLRRAVVFDKETKAVRRDTFEATIWDEVVSASVQGSTTIKTDARSFTDREQQKNDVLSRHSDTDYHLRAMMVSSIGDYQHLDILNKYLPSNPTRKYVEVTQLHHSIRVTHPLFVAICWQFNERLNFFFHTARKYQTQEQLGMFKNAFKGWVDVFIGA